MHALRKSLKKLRYGIEDLASLYDPQRAKPYARGCKRLLDLLGAINDSAMTDRLIAQLGGGGAAELEAALATLGDWNGARREQAFHHLGKAWKALRESRPFWE